MFYRELKLWVQLEDLMNRQLTTELADEDTPQTLTDNLVYHGFICEVNAFYFILFPGI